MSDDWFRKLLIRALDWQDAHVPFDAAVEGIPPEVLGVRPQGLPHSVWQIVEHMRIAQRDILEFCRDPAYKEPQWPQDYWPADPEPPHESAWQESVAAFRADHQELRALGEDPGLDLSARIPHGTGQTYGREFLLVADHNAYHVGQLVLVRRLLGVWKAPNPEIDS